MAGTRVLFFGRSNCGHSTAALKKLKDSGFDTTHVESAKRNEALPEQVLSWSGHYILSFRSLFILPRRLLERAQIAAINFHPGPPEYPGSGCINFALYDDAKEYGVTAHVMNEIVDNGLILNVRRFPIVSDDTVESLVTKSHDAALVQFQNIVEEMSSSDELRWKRLLENGSGEDWRGTARRISDLDSMQILAYPFDTQELKRRLRAVHSQAFPLEIDIEGRRFALIAKDK